MGNRKTEEEKIERVIRSLLKLPDNRRCINCNLLGPQYVCTTFSTFVCTSCSGIHREFTHRVKSVSMAKFSKEEVTALQAGGNERAKQIYFKEWNPQRHFHPDSSNIPKLRDFIKHVYVERRYAGENLPTIRVGEKEESSASKESSSFPRSSPGPRSDDNNLRYLYDESKSPKYSKKYSRQGSHCKSPMKIEVVDDRFRDHEGRNRRLSNIKSKLQQISMDGHQKNVAPPQAQKVTHSGGEGSVEKKSSEHKNDNQERSTDLSTKSLITFSAAGGGPESPHITQPNENNWAIFGTSTENNDPKTSNTASEAATTPPKNPLDLLLSELSCPVTGGMSQSPSGANNDQTTTTAETANTSAWPFTSTPPTESAQPSNEVPPHKVSHAHKPSSMQYLPFDSTGCSSTTQPINSLVKDVALNNQTSFAPSSDDSSWAFPEQSSQTTSGMQFLPPVLAGCSSTTQPTNSQVKDVSSNNHPSSAPSTNKSPWGFTELSSQTTSKPSLETRSDVGSQPSKVETNSGGRMALPEDLFTSSYLSGPAPLAGWQNVQPLGMGYGMQYYQNAVPPLVVLPNALKCSNPFDVTDGRSLMHASSLPTMESLHVVPPTTGLMHASSLGSLGAMMSQSPCYASPVHTGGYQVNHNEQPTRPQRTASIDSEFSIFESLDPIQQSNKEFMNFKCNSFSNTRANPFD